MTIRLGFLIENFSYNYLLELFIEISIQILIFLSAVSHWAWGACSMSIPTYPTVISVLYLLRKRLSSEASSLTFREWFQTIFRTLLRQCVCSCLMCIFPVSRIDRFCGSTSFHGIMQGGRFPASATVKHWSIRVIVIFWSLRPSAGIRKALERQLRDLKTPLQGPQITDVSTTHPCPNNCRTNSTRTRFANG